MSKKLLLGGSPCTFWSIAQTNNRETTASGMGWELFKNYLIAKDKWNPDYYIYENNASAAPAIKNQIAINFGCTDDASTQLTMFDNGIRMTYINSALVSAQNRLRFYVTNFGDISQPEDRGILLKDILDGVERIPPCGADKSRPVTAGYSHKGESEGSVASEAYPENPNKQTFDYCIEPLRVGEFPNAEGDLVNAQAFRVYDTNGKAVSLKAQGGGMGAKTGLYAVNATQGKKSQTLYGATGVAEPINLTEGGKSRALKGQYFKSNDQDYVDGVHFSASAVAESISEEYFKGGFDSSLIGMTERGEGKYRNGDQPSQQYRVYSCEEKNQAVSSIAEEKYIIPTDGKPRRIYYVKDKTIVIKGKEYPINLPDGWYYIRKLSVTECMRLQTVPSWYKFPVSSSRAYQLLGNGWTVLLIEHLLSHIPNWQNEEFDVLSLYDGMSCGQIALKELGVKVRRYVAYEIDKYAIQTTQANFPDTIQMGDAFQVREDGWLSHIKKVME